MESAYRMVIDDPQKMYLLTKDQIKIVLGAAINTVNIQAGMARKEAVNKVKTELILRNTFTTRQIQFTKCSSNIHRLQQVQSIVGATDKAPWLERQEKGGERKTQTGNNLMIAGKVARGGSNARTISRGMYYNRIRTRVVQGAFTRNSGTHMTGTPSSNFIRGIFIAVKENKFFKMNDKIYKITGFQKQGGKIVFKKELVYNIAHKTTKTDAIHWLKPECDKAAQAGQNIFNREIAKISKSK